MIYALLAVSVVLAVLLNVWQRFIEYFPRKNTSIYMPPAQYVRKTIIKNFFKAQKPAKDDRAAKMKISLLKGFKQFLICFSIVAAVFAALQWWLEQNAYSKLAQATVLQVEQRLHWLKDITAPLERWQFLSEIVILLVLIGCAAIWPVVERLKLKERFSKLMKGLTLLLATLAMAASFTFFGNKFSDKETAIEGGLSIHKLSIIEGNRLLLKEVIAEVESRVAQQIFQYKALSQISEERDAVKSSIDSFIASNDYSFFTNVVKNGDNLLQELNALRPGDDGIGDIRRIAEQADKEFTQQYATYASSQGANGSTHSTSVQDVYKSVEHKQYQWAVEQKIVVESDLSKHTVTDATSILANAKGYNPIPESKFFNDFGDIVEKGFQKGYSLTVEKWSAEGLSKIWNGIPFLEDVMEPIHSVLQDYIFDKVKKVYKNLVTGNSNLALSELNYIGPEVNNVIESVNKPNWLASIKKNLQNTRERLAQIASGIRIRNEGAIRRIDDHLAVLKRNSRWERIREAFLDKAATQKITVYPDEPFDRDQWRMISDVLSDWKDYAENNKVQWYKDNQEEIESKFFQYIKDDPKACGTWGFILQQTDWDGAAAYYATYEPFAEVKGNPYTFLKYYCAVTKLGKIDDIYTARVEELGVGPLCKH